MLPDTGFPRDDGMATGNMQENMSGMVQTRTFQTSQAFIHGRRLGVIPSKRANETVRVQWDVVVLSDLVDGRGTDVLKELVGPELV